MAARWHREPDSLPSWPIPSIQERQRKTTRKEACSSWPEKTSQLPGKRNSKQTVSYCGVKSTSMEQQTCMSEPTTDHTNRTKIVSRSWRNQWTGYTETTTTSSLAAISISPAGTGRIIVQSRNAITLHCTIALQASWTTQDYRRW